MIFSFNSKYEAIILPHRFNADFFVFEAIILEIKSAFQLYYENFRQTIDYLKASQVKLGILINFGGEKLNFKRVICSY